MLEAGLEFFAGAEADRLCSGNADLLASSGVQALACFALAHNECAEADDLNLLCFALEALLDVAQNRTHALRSICLRDAKLFGDSLDQIALVHFSPFQKR